MKKIGKVILSIVSTTFLTLFGAGLAHAETTTISKSETVTTKEAPYTYFIYKESSKSVVNGSPRKVSADILCPKKGGDCQISKQYSVSVAETYSISLTSAEKSAVQAGASFSWSKTLSDTSQYTFTMKPGQTAYVQFTPKYKKTTGTLKKYDGYGRLLSSKSVTAYSPKKTGNGEADGTYTAIIK